MVQIHSSAGRRDEHCLSDAENLCFQVWLNKLLEHLEAHLSISVLFFGYGHMLPQSYFLSLVLKEDVQA